MNVLIVTRQRFILRANASGVGVYNTSVVEYLNRRGAHVDVLYSKAKSKDNIFKHHSGDYVDIEEVRCLTVQLLDAVFTKHYALIEVGCVEGLLACTLLGLHNVMPVGIRTHSTPLVFSDHASSYIAKQLHSLIEGNPNLNIIASSTYTAGLLAKKYKNNVETAYIPIDPCLTDYVVPKHKQDGVLFVSRFEDTKDPNMFVELVPTTLKVKILTSSSTSASSWRSLLEGKGYKDFEIKYNLKGCAKAEYLAGAKVAVSVSKAESFGLGIQESLAFSPVLILETKSKWHKNFDGFKCPHLHVVDKDKFTDVLVGLMASKTPIDRVGYLESYCSEVTNSWASLLRSKAKFPDKGRSGSSELSRRLSTGQAIEWQEFSSDREYRKLLQLYKHDYNFGILSRGVKVKQRN